MLELVLESSKRLVVESVDDGVSVLLDERLLLVRLLISGGVCFLTMSFVRLKLVLSDDGDSFILGRFLLQVM